MKYRQNFFITLIACHLALVGQAVFAQQSDMISGLVPDLANGEQVFYAAGCRSCHMAPKAKGDAQLILSGGQAFKTNFGTFYAPNISSDVKNGIGSWTYENFKDALLHGRSPQDENFYPSFPYWSYSQMKIQDVVDLYAWMKGLPAASTPNKEHDLSFPFNQRAFLSIWKAANPRPELIVAGNLGPEAERGRYLVETLGHCGECHTPRNKTGGLDTSRWLVGSHDPLLGRVPGLTPAQLDWSEAEIVEYLTSGFTPEYDVVGGHMASVVDNMAQLPASDRKAIAAYLKKVPAKK